jgi:hypothetical protein
MLAMTYTVNSTDDAADYVDDEFLTLREAVMLVNGDLAVGDLTLEEQIQVSASPPADLTDTIKFDFHFDDPGHLFYVNDNIPGRITLTNMAVTDKIDDGDITNIDPDYQRSWYSIRLVEELQINRSCTIDGYSALKSQRNTNPVGQGLNNLLQVEIWTAGIGNFMQLLAFDGNETVLRGLAINGGGSGVQTAKVLVSDISNVKFEGNFIGTDITGTHIFDNDSNGIQTLVTPLIPGVPSPPAGTHIIGGNTPEARNLITGHQYAYLSNDTTIDFTARIEGNLIGTDRNGMQVRDASGDLALGNERGFYIIRTGATYIVGGPTADTTNVISNNVVGVLVDTTSSATVRNNLIGTDPTGLLDVGNSAVGILLRSGRNFVQQNVVAFNGEAPPTGTPSGYTEPAGIRVYVLPGDPGLLNVFSQNSIFSNFGPGIDLKDDGVTPNDVGDADTGPNSLQNFPELGVAIANGSETTITGTINSAPNTTFRIEFFSTPDIQDQTSGQVYLGFVDVTTDAMGNADINFVTPIVVAENEFITSTATRLGAMMSQVETSEFSAPIQVNLPTFSIDDVEIVEGDNGTQLAIFTVTMSHDQVLPVSVTVNTTAGTAIAGVDYQEITSLLLTFQPGDPLTQNVSVLINGDLTAELDETYFVNLSSPVNATIDDGQGLGTITNDDFPEVSIDDVVVTEGDFGTESATFTVSLSQNPALPLMVTVNTANGTATLVDGDYQAVSGLVLTFMPGDPLTQTVAVFVNGDIDIELNETFFVQLSGEVNAVLVDSEGQGTIVTDDFPTLSIDDVVITEGNSGTKNAVFTVTLSENPAAAVTVTVNTADGTATLADDDYEAVTNFVLTFNPGGPLTQTVTVVINGEQDIENTEDFFVNLSNAVNAIFADEQGVGTITTDDVPSIAPKDLLVLGSEIGEVNTRVKLIDLKNGGKTLVTFAPYGNSFRGGARVALGDLDGDGVAEIITAPGPGTAGLVKVWDLNGIEKVEYRTTAYPTSFQGGVYVAVGDVNGDGWLDIITTPGLGRSSEVRVFRNRNGLVSDNPDPIANSIYRSFLAFGESFQGGATVAAGDLTGDGKAEIVVGNGKGMDPRVRAFDLTTFTTKKLAPRMFEINPFSSSQRNGVNVAVGNIRGSATPEIIVGSGKSANGEVKLYNANGTRFKTINAYSDSTIKGPVYVTAKEIDNIDATLEVVTAQGFTGNRHRRSWQPDGTLVDDVFENDAPFFRGYFVA